MLMLNFSTAKLGKWDVKLPSNGMLFLYESSWDQGRFLAHFYSLVGHSNDQRWFLMHRMTCEPVFALMEQDERNSLTFAARAIELGLVGCHVIIDDSDWTNSFKVSEPYGFGSAKLPIFHYVVNCGNDGLHLLSGDVPKVTELGIISDTEMKTLNSCNEVLTSRLDNIVKPLLALENFRTFQL
jgi:hypothetical protein